MASAAGAGDDAPAALAMLRATLLACQVAPAETAPRLMIVGTYRDDDAPDLPARLNPPGEPALREVRTMKLGRLDAAAIGSLTASMLGAAGAQPSLVSFLQRETEGNALFLVEVVRALAEQAGRLSNVVDMTLPQHLFAGGVRQVVKRRLARVPEAHQDLLKFAAVAGRQLDLRVLGAQHAALTRQADHGRAEKSISGRIVRHTTLDPFLTACADAAVIEIFDGEWRFAHDKIREAVQEDLPPDALAALHRRIAETIEQVYSAEDARIDHLDVLLAHWTEAGSAERQVHYILLAARRLIDLSAQYNRALILLQRAEMLAQTHPYLEASLVTLLNLLGDTYRNQGSYPDAADHYARALALAEATGDRAGEAAALRGLGVVARWQGDTAAAVTYTEQAMALFRALNDLSGIARCLNTLGNIARSQGNFAQARDCFTWSLALRREAGDKRGIAASLFHLGNFAYYEGDHAAALDYFTQSLALREEIGDRQGIAASLRRLGSAADSQRDHTLARQYFAQALDIQREIDDRPGIAATLFSLGEVAYRQGDHDAARDYFTQSLRLRRDIGDRQGQITTLFHRAAAYTAHDAHDEAERDLIECLLLARELDAQSQMVEGLAVYAGLLLARGEARLAAQIAGLAEANPALTAYAREQWLRPLLDGLQAALPDAALDGAMREGAGRSMDDVLGALLARSGAAAAP
jgi:tetratricopeptide (TPR) repeat protein